jgi:hypothetical protein
MPYVETVQSRITRNTVSVDTATFNFPLFATPHNYFSERVRSYASWTEVTQDPAIPSTSVAYKGLQQAFSQLPSPSKVFLGRQETDSMTLTPSPIVNSADYSVKFIVKDDATLTPVTTTVTVTSDASATASEIATLVHADILANVANVTPVDNGGSVTVTADAGYQFAIESLVKLVDSYVTTETAANLLAAIKAESEDWYFMCWSDHSEASILAMAAEIEATGSTNKPKMYFASTDDSNTLKALPDPADDVIGKLKELGYTRTVCDWNHQADTIFPEMADVGYNGPFQPGSTTWKFMQVVGVTAASEPLTGINLSSAKQGYIDDRNGNWMGEERGVNIYREGKVVSGEWIDVIRTVDWLNDTIEAEVFSLLVNRKGGKIPNTPSGRQLIANTIDSVLKRAVDVGALSGYVPTTIPADEDIPYQDKVDRILNDVKWTGYIAGAVHSVITDGNLTYTGQSL